MAASPELLGRLHDPPRRRYGAQRCTRHGEHLELGGAESYLPTGDGSARVPGEMAHCASASTWSMTPLSEEFLGEGRLWFARQIANPQVPRGTHLVTGTGLIGEILS